jgi:hypothetical protein
MNEVEAITNNDQRQLFGQLGFLQEVLDFLRIEMI